MIADSGDEMLFQKEIPMIIIPFFGGHYGNHSTHESVLIAFRRVILLNLTIAKNNASTFLKYFLFLG
jgi:hypothetical protein